MGTFEDAGVWKVWGWVGNGGIKGCFPSRESSPGKFKALGGRGDEVVPEFEGRRPIGGASDKAVDDIRANVLTGLVAVGVGLSGVINTKAGEFDGEGSELAGWGLGSEEGSEKASKGVLNRGEGGFGGICVRNHTLDKLPLLLE